MAGWLHAFANMTSGSMEIVKRDVVLDAWRSLSEDFSELSSQASHFINKVPRHLRNVNRKAYEPELVSIGPYHHGKKEFKPMEDAKLRHMRSLLSRKPEVGPERYLSKIAGRERELRNCYAGPIRFNAAHFIKMLVLDGCFIIGLIRNEVDVIPEYRALNGLEFDMLLLENQIPFSVLRELFDLIKEPGDHTSLMESVLEYCKCVFPGKVLYDRGMRSEDVKHVLDLVHNSWYPPPDRTSIAAHPTSRDIIIPTLRDIIIPSAAELKDANVKFKKKEYGCDTTLFDVDFDQGKGVLSMPPLEITDSTESFLRNLIAYEQYFLPEEPSPVTDYALLLDCLISSPKDVQILCQHDIIQNCVGSEQAVVHIVNRLVIKTNYDPKYMMYVGIFHEINAHRKSRWNTAMAVYHRDYFNSPWAYISFVAALVLLLLTVAQVVFAALQQFNNPLHP